MWTGYETDRRERFGSKNDVTVTTDDAIYLVKAPNSWIERQVHEHAIQISWGEDETWVSSVSSQSWTSVVNIVSHAISVFHSYIIAVSMMKRDHYKRQSQSQRKPKSNRAFFILARGRRGRFCETQIWAPKNVWRIEKRGSCWRGYGKRLRYLVLWLQRNSCVPYI